MATKKAVEAANTAENNEPLNSIAEKEKNEARPGKRIHSSIRRGNLSTQSMSLQKQRQQRLKGLQSGYRSCRFSFGRSKRGN